MRDDAAMTAASPRRRSLPRPSLGLLALLALVAACISTAVEAARAEAAAARPTGQVDMTVVATGPLRAALLTPVSGAPRARHPDPGGTITVRSRLRVGTASTSTSVLLVSFRSRSGERCLGISVYRPGGADPPECLPCGRSTCLYVVRGGGLPASVRVVAGTIDPRASEARVTDAGGRVQVYRASRSRIATPVSASPFLLRTTGVRRIEALRDGVRLDDVRFP